MKKIISARNYASKLTKGYLLAVGILTCIIMSGYVYIQNQLHQNEQYAEVINISGRQRMLSQRIAFFTVNLGTYPDGKEASDYLAELKKSMELMEDTHHLLLEATVKGASAQANSSALQKLYFSPPHNINEKVVGYLKNVQSFLHDYEKAVASGSEENLDNLKQHPGLIHITQNGPTNVLSALNEAVSQYQRDSEAAIGRFELIETIIFSVALLTLLLEVLFIFRPMVSDAAKHLKELERARQHAEDMSRLKTEFLSNMSHEIRTPLNGIVGSASLLKKTKISKDQEKYLDVIVGSGDTLLSLISDVLDISKIEAGDVKINPEPLSIKRLIADLISSFSPKAQSKNIELKIEYNGNIPDLVLADPVRLKQIMFNLIGNSMKFVVEGEVIVRVEETATQNDQAVLKISVEDTGIGIPEDKLDIIFDVFAQADASTTKKYGGTGLGLAITQRLVDLMEGTIGVNSEVGKGTTFWFEITVPILKKDNLDDIKLQKHHSGKDGQPGEAIDFQLNASILLVENEMVNQMVAIDMLETMGCTVDLAENGQEALDMLEAKDNKYDVVLMDCMMPVMDGYEATQEIREREKSKDKHQIIIAMTANVMADERDKCLKAGMDDYLAKPVKEENLYAKLKEYIKGSKQHDSFEKSKKDV